MDDEYDLHPSGLTPKQRKFVHEYTSGKFVGNATRCAFLSGYAATCAHSEGSRLLRNRKVKDAIQDIIAEREIKTKVTAEAVMARLNELATSDISDVMHFRSVVHEMDPDDMDAEDLAEAEIMQTEHGPVARRVETEIVLADWRDLPASVRRCIQSVKRGPNGIEIKLHPKAPALQELGKYLGIAEHIKINGMEPKPETEITEDMTEKEAMQIYIEAMRNR